jgi:hypothetical protein
MTDPRPPFTEHEQNIVDRNVGDPDELTDETDPVPADTLTDSDVDDQVELDDLDRPDDTPADADPAADAVVDAGDDTDPSGLRK